MLDSYRISRNQEMLTNYLNFGLLLVSCEDNRNRTRGEKVPHFHDLLIGRFRATFHVPIVLLT